MLPDFVDSFHDDLVSVQHAQHRAAAAFILARDHDDVIALANFLHKTSGASDTIFIKRSVRNSRVTGPKIRVPIGSIFGVSSTAALPSNLMSDPSGRRTPFAVRTTTA